MRFLSVTFSLVIVSLSFGFSAYASEPLASDELVFEEVDGVLAVEAEHFYKQNKDETRRWYIHSSKQLSEVTPDGDPGHVAGASGGAYLEVLPDTRRTHDDKLISGTNFSNSPGQLAVLYYKAYFNTPGRYYVWVRAYSTGSEDNGIHVGLDGEWPDHGQRMQWCAGKKQWFWESKQRTQEVHCGVAHEIYIDVKEAGEHELMFSLREDGFEFDKFILTQDRDFSRPTKLGPESKVKSGESPKAFAFVAPESVADEIDEATTVLMITASDLIDNAKDYYLDQGKWLAINPEQNESASAQTAFAYPGGKFDVTLEAVGEEDGEATYEVTINDDKIGEFTCPLSGQAFETGEKFHKTWKSIEVNSGDVIRVSSKIASADGQEYSRARVAGLRFSPADEATRLAIASVKQPTSAPEKMSEPKLAGPALVEPREKDGDGSVVVTGELKQWHKVSVTMNGPYAHEQDNDPNPFTDYSLMATFEHEGGVAKYVVPGYFAADGDASNSGAESGTQWRVNFAPDMEGEWNCKLTLSKGKDVAIGNKGDVWKQAEASFTIAASDKSGIDLRSQGRLTYVRKHYLQFAGSKKYFLKAGPDAPETLLAYEDFDGTETRKQKVPLKTWEAHVQDWTQGDPTWNDGRGKGLIGALNYLSSKGCNVFSFLPYNAGGDGDNIWPFTGRDEKFHYDCSKLDQWGIVFDHATTKGLYLHFKLQENEIDDNRRGQDKKGGVVPESLDGGKLGRERKLYCRELIARFGHALALNWNIGEENTQSPEEQRDMIAYLWETDPYQHNIVIHTFPGQQDKVYPELLGRKSKLTGASLQNSWANAHERTLKWLKASAKAGRPWVVCNDEQNPASHGAPPDPGYEGHDGFAEQNGKKYNLHDIRKKCLWGTLMAGGAGVEYYFGYKLPQNDLLCEDFRSREKSWEYCKIAIDFFHDNEIPFWEMKCIDHLLSGEANYCFAKPGQTYLVYMPEGGNAEMSVSDAGAYKIQWFNPREGGALAEGALEVDGTKISFSAPDNEDWLAVISK